MPISKYNGEVWLHTYIDFSRVLDIATLELGCKIDSRPNVAHLLGVLRAHDSLVAIDVPASGETEISDFDVGDTVSSETDEDIFRLQISMHEIVEAMYMNNTFHNLTEQSPDFLCVLIKALGYQISKRLETWVSKNTRKNSLAKGHLRADLLSSRSTP